MTRIPITGFLGIAFLVWLGPGKAEAGCVAMRLHANVWPEWWYEAADEVGMPLIMESALFCNVDEYALSKPKFWKWARKKPLYFGEFSYIAAFQEADPTST
jgi:hypothetical protein